MSGYRSTKALKGQLGRHWRTACAALLTLGLMVGYGLAEPKRVPKPHSYRLSNPPGNVAADHYQALLSGAVYVGFAAAAYSFPNHPDDTIEVFYMGSNGRFADCHFGKPGKYYAPAGWRWKMRYYPLGNRRTPALGNGPDISGNKGGNILPVHNGRTGGMKWYGTHRKRWVDHSHGHIQKRLPRAVWTACPNFPSAKSLGVGVNEKQTAITYFDLVKQDRGQRIMRPDLVTKNPVECRNKQTGAWTLCGRRRDQ